MCGRWIRAKNELRLAGGYQDYWNPYQKRYETYWQGIDDLPKLFHEGGYFGRAQQQGCCEEEVRVRAIMALIMEHELEHRAWMPEWGEPEPAVGGSQDWQLYEEEAPEDHPFFSQLHLQRSTGYSRGNPAVGGESTIMRKTAGRPMHEAFDARDVFIIGLPELFIMHLHSRTARELYDEWLEAEIIIGRKQPRGRRVP